MYTRPEYVWLVYDLCDCEEPSCTGRTDFAVFRSEQIAKQEADKRSKRYGGMDGYPDMHIDKIKISTKTSGY